MLKSDATSEEDSPDWTGVDASTMGSSALEGTGPLTRMMCVLDTRDVGRGRLSSLCGEIRNSEADRSERASDDSLEAVAAGTAMTVVALGEEDWCGVREASDTELREVAETSPAPAETRGAAGSTLVTL
jgi:hypothetical protein